MIMDAELNPFKKGMIILWSGSIASIPNGWALCDGGNGTPELTDLFVLCAGGGFDVDETGGNDTHDHTADQDQHQHEMFSGGEIASGSGYSNYTDFTDPIIDVNDKTILPPYYALAYIMKL